jgi:hypothetical protein
MVSMKPDLLRAGPLERMTAAVDTSARPLIEITDRAPVKRVLGIAGRVFAAMILALFAFGVVMMATMLRWGYVAAGALLLAGVPALLDTLARRSRFVHVVAIAPVAVVVPVMALLGVDVLWSSARLPRPSPAFGLVVAGAVVTGVAYAYLRWIGKPPPPQHGPWALYAGVAALALAALTGQDLPELKLGLTAAAAAVAVWLYLRRAVGPDIKHPLWWALLLVAVTLVAAPLLVEAGQGGRTSPMLLIAAAVIAAVAGLNGLWLPRESERRRLARRAFGSAVVFVVALPLFVFAFVRITSIAPSPPHEEVLPVASTRSPLPRVALDHRPILLFDSGERFRTPLDVDRMLATGHVQLCPEGKGLLASCRTVDGASELRNGFGNLRFDTQQIEDDGLPTTIYAHLVPDKSHSGWTDVDYWWYLPDNPANTAQGAMCGAGLVIPEITCFDHQSDWEGVTVVVDEHSKPVAVHYAAHNHVIDVPWSTLEAAAARRSLRRYAAGRDVVSRPLVFVARGTHAAYPLPCRSSTCNGDTVFEDNRHDGAHAWPEVPCSSDGCVSAFPRAARGAGSASWNAFDGHWGSAVCFAKVYCARSSAPKAPGRQGRYKRPWCYDFTTGADLRRPRPVKALPPGC